MCEDIADLLARKGLELRGIVGEGGYGKVYKVFDQRYNEEFVMKTVKKETQENIEIRILSAISSSHVVPLFNKFDIGTNTFLILQYYPNGTLSERIKRNGPLSKHMLRKLGCEMLHGLRDIHSKNFVHRDIKPSNFLFDQHDRIIFTDFGIGCSCNPGEKINMMSGSPKYIAPEVSSKNPYDPFKADIWSLGLTFYVMATGQLPWQYHDIKQYRILMQSGIDFSKIADKRFAQAIRLMCQLNPILRASIDDLLSLPIFDPSDIQPNSTSTLQFASTQRLTLSKRVSNPSLIFNRKHRLSYPKIESNTRIKLTPTFPTSEEKIFVDK